MSEQAWIDAGLFDPDDPGADVGAGVEAPVDLFVVGSGAVPSDSGR